MQSSGLRALAVSALLLIFHHAQASPAGQSTQRRWRVGVSLLTRAHPFFLELENGLQQAGLRHNIDLSVVAAEFDVDRQNKQIDKFLQHGYDALVIVPADSERIGLAVQKANDAGIPVFTVDIACTKPDAEVVAHIASNNRKGGQLAAYAMAKALHGSGRIVILNQPGITSVDERVLGFREAINRYRRIKVLEILSTDGQREMARERLAGALSRFPDLKGVFAINDETALGAFVAIKQANKDRVILIGYDASKGAREKIKKGTLFYGSVVQHPEIMGRKTMKAVSDYLEGKPARKQITVPVELYRRR